MSSVEHKYVHHKSLGFVLWTTNSGVMHADMARVLLREAGEEIVSAGFCRINAGGAICYGRSESLNIDSRPEDTALLTAQLNLD